MTNRVVIGGVTPTMSRAWYIHENIVFFGHFGGMIAERGIRTSSSMIKPTRHLWTFKQPWKKSTWT